MAPARPGSGQPDRTSARPALPRGQPHRDLGQDGLVTSDDLLGEAVEELYSADPEEFTRRRGELAARARAAGQAAVARQIAGLRKPMRSAWMINQLVRSDPGIATRLAELGEELRAIERSGDGSRMREASQARRQLIATLVPQALASFGTAQGPALALVPPLPDARPSADTTNARKPARPSADTTNARKPARSSADTTNARKIARSSADTANANSERDRRQASAKAEQAPGDAKQHRQADAKLDRRADAKRNQRAKAEQDRQAKAERDRQAKAERARAEAEQAARARAEAERALADAERAEQAARRAQQDREEAVRRLEQELRDVRSQLHEARAQARQAEIARRRARQVLGRLPE
jgi:hypothetical protein